MAHCEKIKDDGAMTITLTLAERKELEEVQDLPAWLWRYVRTDVAPVGGKEGQR